MDKKICKLLDQCEAFAFAHAATPSGLLYFGLEPPRRITTVQGVNLGISHILTAGASFTFGRKDDRVHISRKGGLQQVLEFAEEIPVCLYDTGNKRA